MITQEEAEPIASKITGQARQGGKRDWELVEFDAGWLIRESWASDPTLIGGAPLVIERESGRLMRFPPAFRQDGY